MKKQYYLLSLALLFSLSVIAQFDSLNVTYQGSWGFGQSFSMGTNQAGNLKFVGSGAGVIILDVTDPSNPVKVSEFSTRGLVDAIFFDESTNRLFVTAYFAGFEIWDLSNVASPVRIGQASVIGLPRGGIYADGNYVYVVSVADGVQVFDISQVEYPLFIGSCQINPDYLAWTSDKYGNYIYVALSEGGMAVVDVSVPANPVVAGTYNDIVYGVDVTGTTAYVVSYGFGLNTLDVSNPANITVTGTCAIPGFPYRVNVVGNHAYVGNTDYSGAGGVNVVDISAPANPSLVTTFSGFAQYIAAAGNALAFTGNNMLCTILDITNPASPVQAATYSLPNFISNMYVNGNYAYTGNNGFRVFDVTDKTNPVQIGYNPIDGSIVRTAGNNAVYIRESMTSNNPVMVMDITNPANPTLLGQYNSPVMTNDLEVRDNYAFVSCWWDGIRIVNFEDPLNPVLTSHSMGFATGGTPGVTYCYAQALDVEGNYLYIIDYGPFEGEDTKGLYIMDISDVANPVLVKRFTGIQSYGYDIDAVGNFVYIADNYGGLEIIDVTDKENPLQRGYCNLPDGANSVTVTQNMAFVADYILGGIQVVNVSNPDNPTVAGYYQPSGCFAISADVEGTYIYLADGSGGFQIYNTTLVTANKPNHNLPSVSSTSWPNPFSDNLVIKADNSFGNTGCMIIYNAAGNYITTLLPVTQSNGEVIYQWNGKTANGYNAVPGCYFYRTQDGSVNGKVVKM